MYFSKKLKHRSSDSACGAVDQVKIRAVCDKHLHITLKPISVCGIEIKCCAVCTDPHLNSKARNAPGLDRSKKYTSHKNFKRYFASGGTRTEDKP
jgi:hypothetical protein